jgi:hypothetical protein
MAAKKYPGGPGRRSEPIEKLGLLDVRELKMQVRRAERRLGIARRPAPPSFTTLRAIVAGRLV